MIGYNFIRESISVYKFHSLDFICW